MNYKKYGICFIITLCTMVFGFVAFIVIVDPYFHYHKPLKSINYNLSRDMQRYINDGIVKHFDYDAVITGSSMTENFKTSEFDKLFKTKSVKVPLYGTSFKEINELIVTSIKSNKNIKYIVRSLDYSSFYRNKDEYINDISFYPFYLYNNNLFDDVEYVFNKRIFLDAIELFSNKKTINFDEYSFWSNDYEYGKNALNMYYQRPEKVAAVDLNIESINLLKENIEQNVISTIKNNPDIQFYVFYPPYSIYAFDEYHQSGVLNVILKGEKIVTEMLLQYSNVHIFSFLDRYDIVTNLDLYKDNGHYNSDVNSIILKSMKNKENELTIDNYEEYYEKIINYYNNYDYDSLFE